MLSKPIIIAFDCKHSLNLQLSQGFIYRTGDGEKDADPSRQLLIELVACSSNLLMVVVGMIVIKGAGK